MNLSRIGSVAWAILAVPLLLAGTLAQGASTGIRDEAGFFSESAKSAATRMISEIATSQKRDLVIETYREIPAEARKGVDLKDKGAVKRVFETWSVDRARELGVQGIYVVLTREPSHLQVAVGNATQRQAFTPADRDALAAKMLERLRAKNYDDALIAGVGFVRDTLSAHRTPGTRPSSPTGTSTIPPAGVTRTAETSAPSGGFSLFSGLLPLLLLGVLIFVVIRVIGSLFRRGGSGGMQPGLGGGGGGFMRSMLGGLFGAAAGMWLYNQFTGHGSAWGGETPPSGGDANSDAYGGQDTDYSSSGSDFGDSSGGDSGGDSGGGGGDF